MDLRVHFSGKPYTETTTPWLHLHLCIRHCSIVASIWGLCLPLAKWAFTSQGVCHTVCLCMTPTFFIELMLSGGGEVDFNLRFEKAPSGLPGRVKPLKQAGAVPWPYLRRSSPWPTTNGAIVSRSKMKVYPSGSSKTPGRRATLEVGEKRWIIARRRT